MKRWFLVLASLIVPSVATAQQADNKPVLVLDTGGHTGVISKVLFTQDGKELISVSIDKTIRVWETKSGAPLRVVRPPIGAGADGQLITAALSADGKTLAVAGRCGKDNNRIYLINLASGRMWRVLRGHDDVVRSLTFSPDGRRLVSGGNDKTIRVWDPETGASLKTLVGHSGSIVDLAFSPDGTRLASASQDATARIWALRTGTSLLELRGHEKATTCVAWSPDGKTVATGSGDHSLRLWETNGTLRDRIWSFGEPIESLAFTPDSREILITDPFFTKFRNLGTKLEGTGCKEGGGFDSAISPDAKLVATAKEGEIIIWDRSTGQQNARLSGKGLGVWACAWSKEGDAVVWGWNSFGTQVNAGRELHRSFRWSDLEIRPVPDKDVRRAQATLKSISLDTDTDVERKVVSVKRGGVAVAELKMPRNSIVSCFSLLSEDRAIVGGAEGLFLFDLRTRSILRKFQEEGHAVASSPDGRYFLSASGDPILRVRSPDRDEPLLSLFSAGDDWIAWTPEGYYAASPGGEQLMGWHVNNGPDKMASFYPAAQFRKTLYRPDVIKLLLKTGSVERALEEADKLRGKMTERTEVAEVLPPKATILTPEKSGLQVNKADFEVKIAAQSVGVHPIKSVTLLLNGRSYQGGVGLKQYVAPKMGEVRETWTVTLSPGKHRLQVQVDSAVSRGYSDEVEITYAGESTTEVTLPSLYVLSIGVADYKQDALKLNYAAADARAVAKAFATHGKPLFRKIDTKVLADKDASRAEILKGLNSLRKQASQGDFIVIFYSGHGERDNRQNFYFLPADVDLEELSATGISEADFKKALEGLPCRTLVLVDACHAGALGGDKRKSALTDDLIRDLNADIRGLAILCSSTGRELSQESNQHKMSYFTVALIEGLAGKQKNTNGVVYLHHLESFVKDRVKELTRGEQHPTSNASGELHSFPLTKP